MLIDFAKLNATECYHLMTQTIIPRPIAWVLSKNTKNQYEQSHIDTYNLAPFSYFNAISAKPPLLMISVVKKADSTQKDTTINLKLGEQCVVHIPSSTHAAQVTQSAATLDYGISEVNHLDLRLEDEPGFSLPRLSICKIAFMCEVYDTKILAESEQNLIFLKILSSYISDDVCTLDEKQRLVINANMVDPLARLGANQYSAITPAFDLKRPT